jgi:pimeloyl-ACP methyl ester carboxylesterase
MHVPSRQTVDVGRGVALCYERFGDPANPPLLLIAGLGQQLLAWPDGLCDALAARGLHVVRFDNRDSGESWHAATTPPSTRQLITRRFAPDQYVLDDMARDTAGLIDALELGPVHVAGMSMGGMIGQTLATGYPQYVRSLVSMMSSTGARRAGWPAISTLRLTRRPPPSDREAAATLAVVLWRHIGSHGFPFDEQEVRALAMRSFDRDAYAAAGTARQLAAILKSGDRTPQLRRIMAPTLVVHGDRDRLVHPSGGRATAAAIPRAHLTTIAGMGHDLPVGAWPQLVDLIAGHAARPAPGGAGLSTVGAAVAG